MSESLALAEILRGLHKNWTPHQKQIDIGHALFYLNAKNIFICAGRNFGKTEISAYCTWRWAMQNPGSQNYIFEPYAKQAREILWVSNRIQTFGPSSWIESLNNTEMRITFKNGSFIKLEGSDNVAAIAGIKPKGLIVYDEFKDHRIQSINNFEPNRAAFDVPALFIGTPPIIHNHFVEYAEMAQASADWSYFHAPTSSNPHIKNAWLERMKRQMEGMGELEEYMRSYDAVFVRGGKASIFPWINGYSPLPLLSLQPRDLNKWILLVSFDPASSSVFAATFILHNPHTKKSILLDEIYQSEMALMTTSEIWKATLQKLDPWYKRVRSIEYIYDEAALWFANEMSEIAPKVYFQPSQKAKFGVDGYITLLRNIMRSGYLEIVDSCEKTVWELQNYVKDSKGKIPKRHDHIINALSYGLGSLGYDFTDDPEFIPDPADVRRAYRIEDDLTARNPYAEI